MPCHSTPWRSHLVYGPEQIEAWALTCEPPIDIPVGKRSTYVDEADVFYDDPRAWVRGNMGRGGVRRGGVREGRIGGGEAGEAGEGGGEGYMAWPQYVVFFEQLLPVMRDTLGRVVVDADAGHGVGGWKWATTNMQDGEQKEVAMAVEKEEGRRLYKECARFFNTHWHDDWRRRGDVVVWCWREEWRI